MKYLLIAVLLQACGMSRGDGYNKFLKPCNQVEMLVFNGGDTLYFDTRDKAGIDILVAQVTGKAGVLKDTCAAEGLLRYRHDSLVLLEARFAAAQNGCRYIAYTHDGYHYAHRLNDRATNILEKVVRQGAKSQ